jgi:DNA-binding NarL/FixJ family response regulator
VPYKILIVDDHPLVRDGLALLVASLPGGATIYTANTANSALEQAEFHAPLDAILLDLGLPDANGDSLIEALKWRAKCSSVIVISGTETDAVKNRSLQMGAAAFLPKSKASSEILTTLKRAMAGDKLSSSELCQTQFSPDGKRNAPSLTARQLDILLMLDHGKTNKDIALILGLAEKTVKNHITTLFAELGCVNRLQAVRQARNLSLLN